MPSAIESAYQSPVWGALGTFLLVGAFGVYAFGLGAWILRVSAVAWRGAREGYWSVGLAAGLAALGIAGFGLCWAGCLTPTATWLLLAAGAIPAFQGLKEARSRWRGARPGTESLPAVAWALGGLHLLLLMVFRAVPPTDVDGIAYQLTLPRRYVEAGGLVAIPDLYHSTTRSYATFLHALAWTLGGVRFSCSVTILYFVAVWLALCALGRRIPHPKGTAWVLVAWYAMPLVWLLVTIVGNDIPAACFAMTALLLLEEERDRPEEPGALRRAFLIGLALGFPVAVKLNAAYLSGLLLAVALAHVGRAPARAAGRGIRSAAVLLLAAGLPLAPFLVVNAVETGNPVYPYASSLLGGPYASPAPGRGFPAEAADPFPQRTLLGVFPLLWAIWMEGLHLGPLLVAAVPLVLAWGAGQGASRRAWLCGWVGIVFLVWSEWSPVLPQQRYFTVSRYLLPMASILCLPLGVALCRASERSRLMGVLAALVSAAVIVWGAASVSYTARHVMPFLAGTASVRDYVRTMTRDYDAVEFVNTRLPPHARVLSVTLHSLYLDRPHVISGSRLHFFNFNDFETIEDFQRRARELGITHLLVPRTGGDPHPTMDVNHYARFQRRHPGFPDSHADRLWSGKWAEVYALRDQPR